MSKDSNFWINHLPGQEAFHIYETYGLPVEMIEEEVAQFGFTVNMPEFNLAMQAHADLSRTASAGMFKG